LHSGVVSFIGKPNVGKSSLVNALMGQKLLIVSDKPQTTWHRVNCVWTQGETQVVFSDTPGLHKPLDTMGRFMVKAALGALEGVDLVLWVMDAARGISGAEDYISRNVSGYHGPLFLVLNKIDLVEPSLVQQRKQQAMERFSPTQVLLTSTRTGEGMEELRQGILEKIPSGPFLYDPDTLVDKSARFLVAEIIREKVFWFTQQELPYQTAVHVEHLSTGPDGKIQVRAEIFVNRKSQKGMLIGKQAQLIRKIRLAAQKGIQYLFDQPCKLELYVRVKERWTEKKGILQTDLYFDDDLG